MNDGHAKLRANIYKSAAIVNKGGNHAFRGFRVNAIGVSEGIQ